MGVSVENGETTGGSIQKTASCHNADRIGLVGDTGGVPSAIAGAFSSDITVSNVDIQNCYRDSTNSNLSVKAAYSSDNAKVTIGDTKALSEEKIRRGGAVLLLNHSASEAFWKCRPQEDNKQEYPRSYDGTASPTGWAEVGILMDNVGMQSGGNEALKELYPLRTAEELT